MKEPNGLLVLWNDEWYQIHMNKNNNPVIYKIGETVISVYEKRKVKNNGLDNY